MSKTMYIVMLNENDMALSVHTSRAGAQLALYESYMEYLKSYVIMPFTKEEIVKDIKTCFNKDYIIDYGWITSAPLSEDIVSTI